MNFEKNRSIRQERAIKWESSPLKELKERQNNFQDNQTEVINFFRILLLKKIKEGRPDFNFSDAKSIFQSTELDDSYLIDLRDPYTVFEERIEDLRHIRPTAAELERDRQAGQKIRSLPAFNSDNDGGYFQGPRIHTSGAGTFYTNKYRSPEKPPMKLESVEYRVNLALTQDISASRVLMDLYESLSQNPILAEKGFQMKSLHNNSTDAVIIYCGEQGAAPIVTEVVNYCLKENIGDVPGVPFGVAPFVKDERSLRGLRITSNPSKNYTFNDLQVTALSKAYETVARDFLKSSKASHTFENANETDLKPLHKQLARTDTGLLQAIEQQYAYELEKICGKGVNLHNLAFPVIK